MLVSSQFLSLHQVSLLYMFQFLRYPNVLSEFVYCCFTGTTLFITMFTVLMIVCLLKSIRIPSFAVVSHAHLCPYCNVWPEVVLPKDNVPIP